MQGGREDWCPDIEHLPRVLMEKMKECNIAFKYGISKKARSQQLHAMDKVGCYPATIRYQKSTGAYTNRPYA